MQSKFLERPHSFAYKTIEFIGSSNIFIALCAASLTMWSQQFFLHSIKWTFVGLTFSATFLLYNAQRMYLSLIKAKSIKDWKYKNKGLLIILMLFSIVGLYPLLETSYSNWMVYLLSFFLGIFYFLPFSNLRALPVVKSFTVGLVWVLVCIVAPIEEHKWDTSKLFFCVLQLLFISALCVLFNIRDVEEDRRTKTNSLPVLFGIRKTKIFNYGILLLYLSLCPYVQLTTRFFVICLITFTISCLFTQRASTKNHPFYYTFGVDGLILVQSLLGLLLI
jgi:4-hydroxybenzoate polyprenyltransferase